MRPVYDLLIENHRALSKYHNRWLENQMYIDYEVYRKLFGNLHQTVKNAKYKDFQYRLLLGKIITNVD